MNNTTTEETGERQPTVATLPRRRGVVMRENGISDSYGKRYVRIRGGLQRVKAPVFAPLAMNFLLAD